MSTSGDFRATRQWFQADQDGAYWMASATRVSPWGCRPHRSLRVMIGSSLGRPSTRPNLAWRNI